MFHRIYKKVCQEVIDKKKLKQRTKCDEPIMTNKSKDNVTINSVKKKLTDTINYINTHHIELPIEFSLILKEMIILLNNKIHIDMQSINKKHSEFSIYIIMINNDFVLNQLWRSYIETSMKYRNIESLKSHNN